MPVKALLIYVCDYLGTVQEVVVYDFLGESYWFLELFCPVIQRLKISFEIAAISHGGLYVTNQRAKVGHTTYVVTTFYVHKNLFKVCDE